MIPTKSRLTITQKLKLSVFRQQHLLRQIKEALLLRMIYTPKLPDFYRGTTVLLLNKYLTDKIVKVGKVVKINKDINGENSILVKYTTTFKVGLHKDKDIERSVETLVLLENLLILK